MIAVTDRHLFDAEPDPEGAFLEALAGLLNTAAASALLPPRFLVLREKDLPEPACQRNPCRTGSESRPGFQNAAPVQRLRQAFR